MAQFETAMRGADKLVAESPSEGDGTAVEAMVAAKRRLSVEVKRHAVASGRGLADGGHACLTTERRAAVLT